MLPIGWIRDNVDHFHKQNTTPLDQSQRSYEPTRLNRRLGVAPRSSHESVHKKTSVDVDGLTGDVAGWIAQKKGDRCSELG